VKHLNKFSKGKKGGSSRQQMENIPIVAFNGTLVGTIGEFCVCVKPNFKLS